MTTTPTSSWWQDHEERILDILPPTMLVLASAASVGVDHDHHTDLLIGLAGAAAGGIWMGVGYHLRPAWIRRPGLMGAWIAVWVALAMLLVADDPIFGFYTWTGYSWAARTLPARLRFIGVAGAALATGTSQHGGLPSGSTGSIGAWLGIVIVNFALASGFIWALTSQEVADQTRLRMIDELTEANEKLEATLRENAGLHAQLLDQAREAGVLDERQRMAGEIHDTLAQGLVGIIRQLDAAEQARDLTDARRHTDAAAQLARDSLTEARRSVHALAPAALDHTRLPDALADEARRWTQLSGIQATTRTTGNMLRMRPEIEVALLRTAQEALANVARHAHAGQVVLTLSYMDDLVTLDIRDDGVGFESNTQTSVQLDPAATSGGFGLTAMRQRIEGLAGNLQIESTLGGGTTVAAAVPAVAIEVER